MRSLRRRLQAITLLESLVTLAMMGVIMIVASSLARDYVGFSNNVLSSQKSSRNLATSLETISADLRGAKVIIKPAAAAFEPTLRFDKLDPSFFHRLDLELPLPPINAAAWQVDTPLKVEVTYSCSGDTLYRIAKIGALVESKPVFKGAQKFSTRRDGETVVLKIESQEIERVISLTTEVRVWRF